jgi:hypothetical protein
MYADFGTCAIRSQIQEVVFGGHKSVHCRETWRMTPGAHYRSTAYPDHGGPWCRSETVRGWANQQGP